jgi:pimeloyl-ACP methyl ester carboxylesterase
MRAQEVRDLGRLAGAALGGVAARIQEMHEGIAERAFESIGPSADPVKTIHDRIADRVYGTVQRSLSVAARAGGAAFSLTRPSAAPAIDRAPAGRLALGALNGAFGDLLEKEGSALAVRMTVRRGGEAVEISRSGLCSAFPEATPRLAVFLHGLCETEESWLLGARRHTPYGARLRAELGYTPVYIRYNSGRHISDNGRDLAQLLDELTTAWPIDPTELALIGHSMGGLIVRSACHQGAGETWVAKVRHVFMLGTPHLGAPLEQAANAASVAMASLPETRTFASALNLRSVGVKDLRYGYLLEHDWAGYDPDAHSSRLATEIPFLECANHYFISASLARDGDSPSAKLIGDLLVLGPSAWAHGGRGKRLRFPVDQYRHYGGLNHFQLLNHPAIYEQIRKWLSGRPALTPAPLMLGAGPAAQRP